MATFLDNILWKVIVAICTVAAVLAPFIVYYLQKSKKKLAYKLTSNTRLVGVDNKVKEKVEIYYDGLIVENVHLLIIKFINSGNQEIGSQDFEHPINISLGDDVKILTLDILDKSPTDLTVEASNVNNKVIIKPLLLNAKDIFTLKLLVSNYNSKLIVGGRIKGVSEIEVYKVPMSTLEKVLSIISVVIMLALSGLTWVDIINDKYDEMIGIGVLTSLIPLGIIVIIVQLLRERADSKFT